MCGLFGQINAVKKHFDYRTFCYLGVTNDLRGGDSCGVFIDGNVEYGIDKEKLFVSFMCKSKLITETSKCRIAFGHCRKTSVGATTLETAQPVVIKEDGEIKYVLMHNGTIFNYEKLAEKYIPDIDIKEMSDTQVMANIFYKNGYGVLKEYNGAGAFVIADYRKNKNEPKILMFKGESQNVNDKVIEERPLWYIRSNSGSIFFSSIWEILMPVNKNEDVYTIESNWLYEIRNQSFHKIKEYDRKDCHQNKQYSTTSSQSYANSYCYDYGYSYYDRLYNEIINDDEEDLIIKSHINAKTKDDYILPLPYTEDNICLEDTFYIPKFKKYEKVVANTDLHYHIEAKPDKLMHGGVYVSDYGYVVEKDFPNSDLYWFWQGILLKNEECFNYLEKLRVEFGATIPDLTEGYCDLINYFSVLPFLYGNRYKDSKTAMDRNFKNYSGELKIPFSNMIYTVNDGLIQKKVLSVLPVKSVIGYIDRTYIPKADDKIKDYIL